MRVRTDISNGLCVYLEKVLAINNWRDKFRTCKEFTLDIVVRYHFMGFIPTSHYVASQKIS